VGVRKSLGSKKGQLFWQFMSETALIAFVSTILGYIIAMLFLPSLNELFNSDISSDILFDWRVLTFITLTFIISTVVSGAYPGLILANFKPITALKGKLAQVSVGGFNLRRSLIVVQFVISQVLIIGMLVIIKQMKYSQNADLGFDKEAVVMIPVATGMEAKGFTTFKERLSAFPGIESTTVCMAAPASQVFWGNSITFKGKAEQEAFPMSVRGGDENYVKTFGLNIIAGRNIAASDTINELLINETFVKKMNWESPNEAIGKFMETNGVNDVQIVGVVRDFHDRSMHGDISAVGIGAYNEVYRNFGVKVNPVNISGSLKSIEEVWTSMNPNGIFSYEFVDESIAKFYASEQTFLKLIQLFTIIAIFIGSMGLYGLISFMVERKTKEIGVRKVLGSTNAAILWLFGKEFGLLLLVSFTVASPLAWWLGTEWLQDFKYQVEISPAQFGYALGISTLIALVAIGYKALQASLANPVDSLRSE
jgi:putative ABC transport system permease protein